MIFTLTNSSKKNSAEILICVFPNKRFLAKESEYPKKDFFLVSQYAVTAKSECNTFPTYQWWNGRWIFLYIFSCFLCRFLLMSTSTAKSEDFFSSKLLVRSQSHVYSFRTNATVLSEAKPNLIEILRNRIESIRFN